MTTTHAHETLDSILECEIDPCATLLAWPAYPDGITSFSPMPYGERRWNGATWANIQVDRYNAELARIESRHHAHMDTQHLVNGLYNMARAFDYA